MKRFDQINMIPFIDIMLVLLAIVLTTASFVSKGLIDVDIPSAKQVTVSSQESTKTIEIAVNIKNELFFNEERIKYSQLEEKLKNYEVDQKFVIRMDKKSDFEQFVKIIDVLKAGNFKKLSIQAEQNQ
ncbi:MAG: biopolymer transporter ExbD [Cocleimonas sp.]